MKYICFRFDVDTHKCLRDGVPNLIKLANVYDIKCTFFINTGKSVDRVGFIRNLLLSKSKSNETVYSLSALKKLGLRDYLYIVLSNPVIAQSYPHVIESLFRNGHEIGLHGGHNHQTWQDEAVRWHRDRIAREIHWGIEQIKKINSKITLHGFASPAWVSSEIVNDCLRENRFRYVADEHTGSPFQKIKKEKSLKIITTNITGEPGGVGYIEHCRALQMTDEEILKDFTRKLTARKKIAIVYDHPYYVGVQELPLLEKLIKKALSMKYTFVTMNSLAKSL
jgi:peptidoglycan/xylan/chitin deacetylase (PgdA/CDA1 family)